MTCHRSHWQVDQAREEQGKRVSTLFGGLPDRGLPSTDLHDVRPHFIDASCLVIWTFLSFSQVFGNVDPEIRDTPCAHDATPDPA